MLNARTCGARLRIALALLPLVAGCGAPPAPVPASAATGPASLYLGLRMLGEQADNVMVAGKEYPVSIVIEPPSALADISGVTMYGDRGIECKESDIDPLTWYCLGRVPVDVALIKAELKGVAVPAQPAVLSVQVREPAPGPTAAATSREAVVVTATLSLGATAAPAPADNGAAACPPRKRPRIEVSRPLVTFDALADGQAAPWDIEVTGRVTDLAAQGDRPLWLLVWPLPTADRPGYVPHLHPQSDVDAVGAFPATPVEPDGAFVQLTRFGESEARNRGECFDLIAVLADEAVDKQFADYLARAYQRGSWPGLPADAILSGVEIVGAAQDLIRR